ncbi:MULTISPECIES: ATP-binding cassette domain-containing protein [Mycolicibacterium]|uniref:Component linked with the assembly of cytochrome' ABC transporter ATP-binding protein CydC n=1 Tax=Mycolicibacterium senegalense TaxID=1796 RepID=A0A378T392_9MYCO|nr:MULTISPECIES: ATP-binding cassette domain-containing protein [Mycolicibacterium]MCV7334915.1 ATP-binding cassette domain-containing protein [Mycolicibacterium senegalense]MDR7289997.1 ATP-binding cassette subfamily C protein CydC [Mycolicibacterium senegalense]QZA26775.1 ATP-binding cassette domain-containing protein [Mycolicibacterium senegalense]CDP82412.1 ABC transporter, transmembrane region, type 1 [Mycolicibacterium farcinogenes]STZ54647.1 Component linked with the assembly of cytochr
MFRRDPLLLLAVELLRPRLSRLILASVLGVLSLGSALALAGVSAWLITRAWQMPPILDLSVAVVAVRALGISRGVLGYCQRLAAHDTALRAAANARSGLYRKLAAAPDDDAMRLPSGELVARVGSSVDELADVVVRSVLPIVVAIVLSTVSVGVIALISPSAAAVLGLCLLVAGAVAPAITARAVAAAESVAVQQRSDRDAAAMLALEYAPELRVSGRLDEVIATVDRRHRDWGRAADRAALPAALAAAMPSLAIGASVLGAVAAGIALATTTAPTTLAILMLLPLSAFEATTALPDAAVGLTKSRIAARRLLALTHGDPEARRRPQVAPVDLPAGGRLAVVGPSGSGKTTLLMAMADRLNENSRRAAFFAEDAHIFETTVRDNLLVVRGDATDAELLSALERVGLTDWLSGLPEGLATVLEGGHTALSAGQRRRLLLARVLLSDFSVVLLDEPTENLDAGDGQRVLAEILTPGEWFGADRAVVVATHHLPDTLDCPVVRCPQPGTAVGE